MRNESEYNRQSVRDAAELEEGGNACMCVLAMCGKFFAAATSGCTAGEYVCVSSTRTRTGSISQDQDARLRAEKRMEVPAGSSGGGYFLPATTKFAIMQLTSRKREKILSLSVCDDDVFTRKRFFLFL